MRKNLFSSKAVRVLAVVGALAALPVTAASANTTSKQGSSGGLLGSTSLFATAQGTSLLGIPLPVLGTRGYTLTVPVNSQVIPQLVKEGLDFTITGEINVGGLQILDLYVDPRMS